MLGPVLIKYGSEAQKRHWLPRILDGTDWWCQGYSEPGAGSDLAAVQTTAVRDGDDYIVNGQKTWTTLGHYANMIFCLVRTSHEGRRQEGISFLLIDMRSPAWKYAPSSRWTASTRSTRCSSRTCGCRPRTWWARKTGAGPAPSTC